MKNVPRWTLSSFGVVILSDDNTSKREKRTEVKVTFAVYEVYCQSLINFYFFD